MFTYCHHSVEMVNIDMDKYSIQSGQDLLTNGLRNKNRKSIRQLCYKATYVHMKSLLGLFMKGNGHFSKWCDAV